MKAQKGSATFCFVFVSFLRLSFVSCRLNEEPEQNDENSCGSVELHCYHRPREMCPPPEDNCRCRVDACKEAVICCDVDTFRLTEGLGCANVSLKTDGIKAIHIRNATIDTLSLTDVITWRRVTSMSMTDGIIRNVVGEFGKYTGIACLNLSSNGIVRIEDRSLVNLYNLKLLDLSNNNLTEVPRFKKEGLVTLDISANFALPCSNITDVLNRGELNFNNKNSTWCIVPMSYQWFNTTNRVSFLEMETHHKLKEQCFENCTCETSRFVTVVGKLPVFTVMMNCSSRNFTQLPTPLPPNTTGLNVSNNNIKLLDSIGNDTSYQSLRQLYADNNEISSILPLEGTKFIANFDILSLRNNKLRSLPTYVLSNVFDRNYNSRMVYLGGNKLTCDCSTAKVFKVWLVSKHKSIPDYNDVVCENMESRVSQLDATKLCHSQHDWSDYIYFIIFGEVLLLVCLFTKVTYDYWVFKTAGYLPWPASKMPKLPCDWLCE